MTTPKQKPEKAPETNAMSDAMAGFPLMNPQIWQDIMSESARFVTERLQRDLRTQQAMLSCKSPVELMKVQSDFVQNALSDYTEEASRMFKLLSGGKGTSRKYDDVPL